MTAPDPLDPIRARAVAATPGPWEADGTGEVSQHWSRPEPWKQVVSRDVACMSYCYGGSAQGVCDEADAKFIAHAREDVPALLAALDAVLAEVQMWEQRCTTDDTGDVALRAGAYKIRAAVSAALGGGE